MTSCNSCQEHFTIGCFGHCEAIGTGFVATETGVHQIIVNFLGSVSTIEIELEIGEEITIPSGSINEDSETFFTIKRPNNQEYVHTFEAVNYSCFKVTVKISF